MRRGDACLCLNSLCSAITSCRMMTSTKQRHPATYTIHKFTYKFKAFFAPEPQAQSALANASSTTAIDFMLIPV